MSLRPQHRVDKILPRWLSRNHFDVLYVMEKFLGVGRDVAIRLGKLISRRRQILFLLDELVCGLISKKRDYIYKMDELQAPLI